MRRNRSARRSRSAWRPGTRSTSRSTNTSLYDDGPGEYAVADQVWTEEHDGADEAEAANIAGEPAEFGAFGQSGARGVPGQQPWQSRGSGFRGRGTTRPQPGNYGLAQRASPGGFGYGRPATVPDRAMGLSRPQRAHAGALPDLRGNVRARPPAPTFGASAADGPRCFFCGTVGHRVRDCPRKPTPEQISTALHDARAKARATAVSELKRVIADKAANRAGRLSGGQQRAMEQAIADFGQLQADACRDVAEAVGQDRQAFAHLSHLAYADLQDAHGELHKLAEGIDFFFAESAGHGHPLGFGGVRRRAVDGSADSLPIPSITVKPETYGRRALVHGASAESGVATDYCLNSGCIGDNVMGKNTLRMLSDVAVEYLDPPVMLQNPWSRACSHRATATVVLETRLGPCVFTGVKFLVCDLPIKSLYFGTVFQQLLGLPVLEDEMGQRYSGTTTSLVSGSAVQTPGLSQHVAAWQGNETQAPVGPRITVVDVLRRGRQRARGHGGLGLGLVDGRRWGRRC